MEGLMTLKSSLTPSNFLLSTSHNNLPDAKLNYSICVCNFKKRQDKKIEAENTKSDGRRDFLFKSAAISTALIPLTSNVSFFIPSAFAEDVYDLDYNLYEDAKDAYSLLIPKDWKFGEGKAGTRKVIGFYPESENDINVNLVITMLGADFTSMGSFGSAEIFGENLVNTMDRSYLRPPGQEARLIDTKSKNGKYYIEYT